LIAPQMLNGSTSATPSCQRSRPQCHRRYLPATSSGTGICQRNAVKTVIGWRAEHQCPLHAAYTERRIWIWPSTCVRSPFEGSFDPFQTANLDNPRLIHAQAGISAPAKLAGHASERRRVSRKGPLFPSTFAPRPPRDPVPRVRAPPHPSASRLPLPSRGKESPDDTNCPPCNERGPVVAQCGCSPRPCPAADLHLPAVPPSRTTRDWITEPGWSYATGRMLIGPLKPRQARCISPLFVNGQSRPRRPWTVPGP